MKKIVISLILIVLILVACSPAVDTATPVAQQEVQQEEPQATVVTTANFPIGRFVSMNNLSKALLFADDGSFAFYFSSKIPAVTGKYTVDGSQLSTVNPSETNPDCINPATYTWSFDGSRLTISSAGDDPCKPRRDSEPDTYIMDTSSMPEITIEAADFAYTMPDSVSEGWVRIKLTNSGAEPHHVQFMRLNDGVTFEQFQEALQQGEGPAMALVQQLGGVGAIAPGIPGQAVLNLPAGEYVVLCLIPSPSDNVPHFAKGMIDTLTVEKDVSYTLDKPTPSMVVRLKDFTFELPDELPVGQSVVKVINDGPEAHEFNILKLAEGKTAEDVRQFLAGEVEGPPPFIPVGGMNGLDAGLVGYAELDLEPGTYAAICNIPSPVVQGTPHSMLGMIKEFSVGSSAADKSSDDTTEATWTTFSSDRFGYSVSYPAGWVVTEREGEWPAAEAIQPWSDGVDVLSNDLSEIKDRMDVAIGAQTLPQPMTLEEWAATQISAMEGDCGQPEIQEQVTLAGQDAIRLTYHCDHVYLIYVYSVLGDQGYGLSWAADADFEGADELFGKIMGSFTLTQ